MLTVEILGLHTVAKISSRLAPQCFLQATAKGMGERRGLSLCRPMGHSQGTNRKPYFLKRLIFVALIIVYPRITDQIDPRLLLRVWRALREVQMIKRWKKALRL
jgi:hypothetical protein